MNLVSTKKDIEIKRSLTPKRFRLLKTSSEEICLKVEECVKKAHNFVHTINF